MRRVLDAADEQGMAVIGRVSSSPADIASIEMKTAATTFLTRWSAP